MRALVLGAGLAGAASAYYLTRAGVDVTVLDRRDAPAQDTSFANGGQISAGHTEPWAAPGIPLQALKAMFRADARLAIAPLRAGPEFWLWGLKVLRQCTQTRLTANMRAMLALALYSRASLEEVLAEETIDCDMRREGILRLYHNPAAYARACSFLPLLHDGGIRLEPVSPQQARTVEPALDTPSGRTLAGALHSPDDLSGDARRFATEILARAQARGAAVRLGATIDRLVIENGRATGVVLVGTAEVLRADAVICCLGVDDGRVLRSAGLRLPIYPAKGYSVTYDVTPAQHAPTVSLTHEDHRIVISRLGDRLRAAGTAEFSGYGRTIHPARVAGVADLIADLLPDFPPETADHGWLGLRPKTPDSLPHIGASPIPGLFTNSGHGYLGWTWACGSARLLTQAVTGAPAAIDPAPYRVIR